MKKNLLLAGVLLGLAIVIIPFAYFLHSVLKGNLRFFEILAHGKYLIPAIFVGGLTMVICIHKIPQKNQKNERG